MCVCVGGSHRTSDDINCILHNALFLISETSLWYELLNIWDTNTLYLRRYLCFIPLPCYINITAVTSLVDFHNKTRSKPITYIKCCCRYKAFTGQFRSAQVSLCRWLDGLGLCKAMLGFTWGHHVLNYLVKFWIVQQQTKQTKRRIPAVPIKILF